MKGTNIFLEGEHVKWDGGSSF